MWLALAIAGIGEIYVLVFQPGTFDTGDIFVVPFLATIVIVLFEIIHHMTNYVIFHPTRVDVSTSDWAARGSRRSARLPYESVDSEELDPATGEVKITYRPQMWQGKYSPYRQEIKFRPKEPGRVLQELDRRAGRPSEP